MKFYFEVPPDDIYVFSFILESYEDVGVITTYERDCRKDGGKAKAGKPQKPSCSIVLANIADDYIELFNKIVDDLKRSGLRIKPVEVNE